MPETCRGVLRNILKINCALSWFFFPRKDTNYSTIPTMVVSVEFIVIEIKYYTTNENECILCLRIDLSQHQLKYQEQKH